jgi:hypothetical protein
MIHCPAAAAPPYERDVQAPWRGFGPRVLVAPDHDARRVAVCEEHGLGDGGCAEEPEGNQ